jgi:uncharacterized repeat protein (TIGR01451 family)
MCAAIENTAMVNWTDPCENDVSKAASWLVSTSITESFDIIKTANVTNATIGDVIGYTIVVTNTGNVNATKVNVTDELTSGSSYVETKWTIPKLSPGENETLHTKYTVKETDLGSPIDNDASITSYVGPCGGKDYDMDSNVTVPTD